MIIILTSVTGSEKGWPWDGLSWRSSSRVVLGKVDDKPQFQRLLASSEKIGQKWSIRFGRMAMKNDFKEPDGLWRVRYDAIFQNLLHDYHPNMIISTNAYYAYNGLV